MLTMSSDFHCYIIEFLDPALSLKNLEDITVFSGKLPHLDFVSD